jgi:hypothetical protein
MINEHPASATREKAKTKLASSTIPSGKSSSIFEIKEAPDEDELETPLNGQKSGRNSKISKNLDQSEPYLTEVHTERNPNMLVLEENSLGRGKPASKSVENFRNLDPKPNEDLLLKSKKDPALAGFHKKINMDIFAIAPARKPDKPKPTNAGVMTKKILANQNGATSLKKPSHLSSKPENNKASLSTTEDRIAP